jgi:putative ABC transport system permease protein
MGAKKIQLITQFLIETFLLTLAAGVLAVLIASLLIRPINFLLDVNLDLHFFQSPLLIISFLIGLLLLGFFAGLYPSVVIARFMPSELLKSAKEFSILDTAKFGCFSVCYFCHTFYCSSVNSKAG